MAAAEKTLVVIGAAAVLRLADGSDRYLYKGAPVDPELYTADSITHVTGLGLVGEVEVVESETTGEDEPYKGVTVADLKVEIETRNKDREDDAKVVPAEPGNRPEIVAALVADDAKQQS